MSRQILPHDVVCVRMALIVLPMERDNANHENMSFHYLPKREQSYGYAIVEHLDLLTFKL